MTKLIDLEKLVLFIDGQGLLPTLKSEPRHELVIGVLFPPLVGETESIELRRPTQQSGDKSPPGSPPNATTAGRQTTLRDMPAAYGSQLNDQPAPERPNRLKKLSTRLPYPHWELPHWSSGASCVFGAFGLLSRWGRRHPHQPSARLS